MEIGAWDGDRIRWAGLAGVLFLSFLSLLLGDGSLNFEVLLYLLWYFVSSRLVSFWGVVLMGVSVDVEFLSYFGVGAI